MQSRTIWRGPRRRPHLLSQRITYSIPQPPFNSSDFGCIHTMQGDGAPAADWQPSRRLGLATTHSVIIPGFSQDSRRPSLRTTHHGAPILQTSYARLTRSGTVVPILHHAAMFRAAARCCDGPHGGLVRSNVGPSTGNSSTDAALPSGAKGVERPAVLTCSRALLSAASDQYESRTP